MGGGGPCGSLCGDTVIQKDFGGCGGSKFDSGFCGCGGCQPIPVPCSGYQPIPVPYGGCQPMPVQYSSIGQSTGTVKSNVIGGGRVLCFKVPPYVCGGGIPPIFNNAAASDSVNQPPQGEPASPVAASVDYGIQPSDYGTAPADVYPIGCFQKQISINAGCGEGFPNKRIIINKETPFCGGGLGGESLQINKGCLGSGFRKGGLGNCGGCGKRLFGGGFGLCRNCGGSGQCNTCGSSGPCSC